MKTIEFLKEQKKLNDISWKKIQEADKRFIETYDYIVENLR